MENRHTRGPWICDRSDGVLRMDSLRGGQAFAKLSDLSVYDEALIEAAPDLLDACLEAWKVIPSNSMAMATLRARLYREIVKATRFDADSRMAGRDSK